VRRASPGEGEGAKNERPRPAMPRKADGPRPRNLENAWPRASTHPGESERQGCAGEESR